MQTAPTPQVPAILPEQQYLTQTTLEHRKRYAQFFTPLPVAKVMADWLLAHSRLETVLDPAFGLGVFARVLWSQRPSVRVEGWDIDTVVMDSARQALAGQPAFHLRMGDYLQNDWKGKFDGIICNPPYFKFHDYDNVASIKEFEGRLAYRLSGFTNQYALFLLKALSQLKPDGRLAFVVPSEFLNSDYGVAVKMNLLMTGMLRHVIVFNFEENIFDSALTTSCIILCSNDSKSAPVDFRMLNQVSDLAALSVNDVALSGISPVAIVNPAGLDAHKKWRSYYQTPKTSSYRGLVPVSNFAKVVRGIATGGNEFFVFDSEKAREHQIKDAYLLPTICKATDAKGPFFTQQHFETLVRNGRPAFLLNAASSQAPDQAVMHYLESGKEAGIHLRHLTAHRTPWYALERRPPAPIWVGVFNRTGLKFIRNEAQIANLTAFHCVYPNEGNLLSQVGVDILFAYFLCDIAKEIFSDNRREYGNGLQKFEPNDLNKAMMLDLTRLRAETISEIRLCYERYRAAVLDEQPSDHLLQELERIFTAELIMA